ncbi:MAG: hypothetical protein NT033_01755 [Candidatus Omnitrophica bacterium]|nr:hypothetical protein [Candidatus Omnitrophota bacterium]
MRSILALFILALALTSFVGCRSINVGANGQIGTVTGGGSVNIPIP